MLISLVKLDNITHYIDRSAKIYYTGKKFPTTVALNKLFFYVALQIIGKQHRRTTGKRGIQITEKGKQVAKIGFRSYVNSLI